MIPLRKLHQVIAKGNFLKDRNRINFFILISVAVVYLFLFFIPQIKVLFFNLAEGARLKAKIIKTEQDWANIVAFKERISKLNREIDYYEKKLPSEKEIPAVLEYLSDAAKGLNVSITEIKPVEQEKEEQDKAQAPSVYYKAPFLLKAECGYHQLGRFLNKLESADRFMKISDIKIVANPHKKNIHYIQLTVVTYVMKR